jgi:hypothetical protein
VYQIRALLRDRRGTAEQYASAFAVLARTLGYDTRVAVGFRTRADGGRQRVSGRDVDAWPEVRFQGIGWVAFAPTPSTRDSANQAAPAARSSPTPSPAATRPDSGAGTCAGPGAGAPAGTGVAGRGAPWLPAVAALAVAALAVLAGSAALRVRYRRRRRRGDPRRRLAAAWRDALGSLRAAGAGAGPATTSRQVAALAGAALGDGGGGPVTALAALHDRAAFADGAVTDTDADSAWRLADELRAAARARVPRWRRFAAAVRPWPDREPRRR